MFVFSQKSVFFITAVGLFLLAIGFLLLASHYVEPQATMDAAYYHILAGQLENGKGFTEPIIWQFLKDYKDIERPMDYWMPLGIIFYYLARTVVGVAGEVWLNILIWSLLSSWVFIEVKSITRSTLNGFFAYCTMLFSGRIMFHLLTTDNIAFYALFGFLFFKLAGRKDSNWALAAIVGGMSALMRIEGVIIAFFGGMFEFFKTRSLKVLAGYLLVLIVVLAPWMVRNYTVLGHPWPSNSKGLYLKAYEDLFREGVPGTLESYLSLGYEKIYDQKMKGLRLALINLIAFPGMFVFYPLWLFGLIKIWRREGKFFAFLLSAFVLFCGLAFPLQAEKGTAMHISAYFFPWFAILNGVGLSALTNHYRVQKKYSVLMIMILVSWSLVATHYSAAKLIETYVKANAPYTEILAGQSNLKGSNVVSDYPVRVYLQSKAGGVVYSPLSVSTREMLAKKMGCSFILIDKRADKNKWLGHPDWKEIASNSELLLFGKK